MRTITVFTQLENGATPTMARIVMLSRAEVLKLAEDEVLLGNGDADEALVIWLADDMDAETTMIEGKFAAMFERNGVPMETWRLQS